MSLQQNNALKAERNSNIELLRIISIFIIILHHFAMHCNASAFLPAPWYNLIVMGGKIGVNVFVLISGYFLINDTKLFNFKKTAKLWGEIFFYSVSLFVIFTVASGTVPNIKTTIKAFMPITFDEWWFATTYFILYIFHPFLNKFLLNLNKKDFQKLLVLMFFCWSVIPTFTGRFYEANNLIWFAVLYCISAYIRLFGVSEKYKRKSFVLAGSAVAVLTYLSSLLIYFLGKRWSFFSSHQDYFFRMRTVPVLFVSICLFMTFAMCKEKHNKFINCVSSATFGVYLIHDCPTTKDWMWNSLFNMSAYKPLTVILCSVAIPVLIYAICTAIDLARQYTAEKIYMKIIAKMEKKFSKSKNITT